MSEDRPEYVTCTADTLHAWWLQHLRHMSKLSWKWKDFMSLSSRLFFEFTWECRRPSLIYIGLVYNGDITCNMASNIPTDERRTCLNQSWTHHAPLSKRKKQLQYFQHESLKQNVLMSLSLKCDDNDIWKIHVFKRFRFHDVKCTNYGSAFLPSDVTAWSRLPNIKPVFQLLAHSITE